MLPFRLTFTIALPAFSLTLKVADVKSIFVGGTANATAPLNKNAAAAKTEMLRRGDRLIKFVTCEVVIFFVEAGLLNGISLQSRSARNQEPSSRGALNSGFTAADSGLQLSLEIALSGVSAKVQPHEQTQLGRRCVETSGDEIGIMLRFFLMDV